MSNAARTKGVVRPKFDYNFTGATVPRSTSLRTTPSLRDPTSLAETRTRLGPILLRAGTARLFGAEETGLLIRFSGCRQ